VQSAVVVGPAGEDIHTDEFGRVRVQFHWDREGRFDERSSCWVRVSQGWAGGAYGMVALPRVGQEVLVGFIEGDPDQPVVVGRVFNNTTRVPYKLPEQRTVSTWKSNSTPGSEGFNEILLDDAAGGERVYIQAEKDLEKLVKQDESDTIGNNLNKVVRANETESTGANRTIMVGINRTTTIGATDTTMVGVRHAVTMAPPAGSAGIAPTGLEMVDRKITLSTGEATITLEGPNITLEAAAAILLQAASTIRVQAKTHIQVESGGAVTIESKGGDILIQGGPMVRINPETGGKDRDEDDDDEELDEDDDDDEGDQDDEDPDGEGEDLA
jgi:type VI secretion system secreted protein VgrG